jgi:DNA-binding NarL/FixJ family response regulator
MRIVYNESIAAEAKTMKSSGRNSIRVVLADDHAVVRKGIREYLEDDNAIRVIGEASDGAEAVALVAREHPDVAVFDIQMPRMNGLEATRQVKQQQPTTRVLILTAYDDDPYIFAALQAGASGYLLKTASPAELVQAVHALMADESALSPLVAKKLVQRASGKPAHDAIIEPLSEREMEVLRLAAQGKSNRQIAGVLSISDRTVQGHLANIYGKLNVSTRTEAVLFAVREKWITLD